MFQVQLRNQRDRYCIIPFVLKNLPGRLGGSPNTSSAAVVFISSLNEVLILSTMGMTVGITVCHCGCFQLKIKTFNSIFGDRMPARGMAIGKTKSLSQSMKNVRCEL